MNRKEASFILANIDRRVCDDELNEALDVAIKALEQEPCEDAINRQAAIDEAFEVDTKEYGRIDVVGVDAIESLPPVTPQPKTGHWSHDGSHWKNRFICSGCGYKLFDEPTNYCPNCGARMVEPQERSDKE